MKKLLALIKSRGKTKKQLVKEVTDVLRNKEAINENGELQIIFFRKNPKTQKQQ